MEDFLQAIERHAGLSVIIAFWITSTLALIANIVSPYKNEGDRE